MGLYKTNCVKNKSQQLGQLEAKYQEIIETVAPDFLILVWQNSEHQIDMFEESMKLSFRYTGTLSLFLLHLCS